MQRKIEQLAGQARKLSSSQHPLHFLLYSSNKHLQEDSKYVDLQVGKQVWFNVPRRMRQELWLSVLHKHRGAGATAAKQYVTLVRQALPVDVDADIEKDVGRTFPNAARFATDAGKQSLLRVLRAYAVYDTEVGYCQGMNFLAGLLLTWMPNEATAFGGLVVLMQQRMLRELYKADLARLQVYLWQFSKLLPARLGQHMEAHGVLPVLYLSSWLLTSFGSDFPLFFSSRVLDVVLTGSYPHAVLKVAITLLRSCGKKLLALGDMEDIVAYLKAEVPNWSREVLQDVLSDALSQAWTPAQEAILGSEAGMETVVDAVGRVNAAAQDGALAEQMADADQASAAVTSTAALNPSLPPAASLGTPTRPESGQQLNGGSPGNVNPLSSGVGRSPLPSVRSASWTARLRALPTSPSLPVQSSSALDAHTRRRTTELPAHNPSSVNGPIVDNDRQHTVDNPAQQQLEVGQDLRHSLQHFLDSSAPQQTEAPNTDTSQQSLSLQAEVVSHASDSVEETRSRHIDSHSAAAPDLLSFNTHHEDVEHVVGDANGSVLHDERSSSEFGDYQQSERSDGVASPLDGQLHAQSSLAASQLPDLSPSSSHVWSDPSSSHVWSDSQQQQPQQQQQHLDDPFRLAAEVSREFTMSDRGLSGPSLLSDPQGSDLDSWGSFLLPDEPSNLMTDNMQSTQQQPLSLQHVVCPPVLFQQDVSPVDASAVLSPHSQIISKQRQELDRFMQSSSAK